MAGSTRAKKLARLLTRIALGVAVGIAALVAGVILVVTNPLIIPPERRTVPAADPDALKAHVVRLASTVPARNHANVGALAETLGYIRSTWTGQGHQVQSQPFSAGTSTFSNVWITCGPETADRVIIGAHYDVCGDQPGADDNASGVAAILELGRLLPTHRPALDRRIDLVAYANEEPPYFKSAYMGSVVHARSLKAKGARVRGVVALDMVGYFKDEPGSQSFPNSLMGYVYPDRGDFLAVVAPFSEYALTRRVKDRLTAGTALPIYSMNAPVRLPGVDFSDHRSYWPEGYHAVLVTDTSFYRNAQYHQKGDVPERLDYRRLAEVVAGLYVVATEL